MFNFSKELSWILCIKDLYVYLVPWIVKCIICDHLIEIGAHIDIMPSILTTFLLLLLISNVTLKP